MAYNNRRRYNSRSFSNKKIHISKRLRNRIIIIAVGLVIFALIIALISSVFSCICTGSAKTEPTVDTATVATATKAAANSKPKANSIEFIEPKIKDDQTSEGAFDGEYYIWNSKAFEAFKGTTSNAKSHAKVINKAKKKLGLSVNVYSAIIPTHIEMGLPNRLKNNDSGIYTNSQADYIKAAYKKYSKKVKFINCYNLLSQHCNDYIYFDSDFCPTGLGGYYVYKSFADTMKKNAVKLSDCKESKVDNFTGYYNNLVDTELNVDTVQYWDFKYGMKNTITNSDGAQDTAYSCYNKEAETGADAYNVFLYGKNPLEVIKSESGKANGKIAIIHNKTGNSTVPYFTHNYKEVYSIDYTLYDGSIKNLCAENKITDVLFLTDADSSSDSDQLSMLKNIL